MGTRVYRSGGTQVYYSRDTRVYVLWGYPGILLWGYPGIMPWGYPGICTLGVPEDIYFGDTRVCILRGNPVYTPGRFPGTYPKAEQAKQSGLAQSMYLRVYTNNVFGCVYSHKYSQTTLVGLDVESTLSWRPPQVPLPERCTRPARGPENQNHRKDCRKWERKPTVKVSSKKKKQ